MIECTGTPAEQFLERYIQGTLSPMEQEEFEAHYFDCPACLEQVEALQVVTGRLARHPVETPRPLLRWPAGLGALAAIGAIAAMLVIGFFCYRTFAHRSEPAAATSAKAATPQPPVVSQPSPSYSTPSSPAVSALADLALPAFQTSSLRGTGEDSTFDTGMKFYSKADCRQAIATLSRVGDGNAPAAHFYTGICQIHEMDFDAATASLRRLSDAGDSPQQEAAIYYLAQIALAKNDPASARQYLVRTIALHGDFERRAQVELAKLPQSAPHQ